MKIKTNENNGWYNREINITAPDLVLNSYYAESYFEISCGYDTITINSAEKFLQLAEMVEKMKSIIEKGGIN